MGFPCFLALILTQSLIFLDFSAKEARYVAARTLSIPLHLIRTPPYSSEHLLEIHNSSDKFSNTTYLVLLPDYNTSDSDDEVLYY